MNDLSVVERPKFVVPMPFWPGPRYAIELAISGVREDPPLAVGGRFGDGSEIILEYQLARMRGVPDELYDTVGEPPLLSILVVDHGVAVRLVNGIGQRIREHDAERALQSVQKLLGRHKPLGVISKGIDETDTRRRYWMRADA